MPTVVGWPLVRSTSAPWHQRVRSAVHAVLVRVLVGSCLGVHVSGIAATLSSSRAGRF